MQSIHLNDVLNISITYKDGSIGTIAYYANGSKALAKERIEIYSHGVTGVLNDFKKVTLYGAGKSKTKKLMVQDKGQKKCVRQFIESIQNAKTPPVPFTEIVNSAEVCFGILKSLKTNQVVPL